MSTPLKSNKSKKASDGRRRRGNDHGRTMRMIRSRCNLRDVQEKTKSDEEKFAAAALAAQVIEGTKNITIPGLTTIAPPSRHTIKNAIKCIISLRGEARRGYAYNQRIRRVYSGAGSRIYQLSRIPGSGHWDMVEKGTSNKRVRYFNTFGDPSPLSNEVVQRESEDFDIYEDPEVAEEDIGTCWDPNAE